jgi:pimeloyl-ACP methyl ester carboxylesterase
VDQVHHVTMAGDGISMHVARAGTGTPILLLHGFPESWRSWQHQLPALAAAGFAVYAPDLRGYGESDRPSHPGAYHMRHLVADVAALVRATGHPRAHIAGHDWGGVLAWTFAGVHPELVDRLVVLNAPHIDIYRRLLARPSRQRLRSWYLPLFRVPGLAEWLFSRRNFHLVRDLFGRQPARPAFSAADIEATVAGLARPGALTAALRWYRDNAAPDAVAMQRAARTDAPTLVIWGERDATLGPELLHGLERYAPRLRVHLVAGASHWVQNEAPAEVTGAMTEFLKEPAATPRPPDSEAP